MYAPIPCSREISGLFVYEVLGCEVESVLGADAGQYHGFGDTIVQWRTSAVRLTFLPLLVVAIGRLA